jgi:plasmid stabilization system protein ParE
MERTIVWNKQPSRFLAQSLKWISADSTLQAERVESKILSAIQSIPANPKQHPPDKFKRDNSGDFRAFELASFRVAYKITDSQIRILRIRHIKQEPKQY